MLGEYFMSIRSIWTLNCGPSDPVLPFDAGRGRKSCLDESVARKRRTVSRVTPGIFFRRAAANSFSTPTFPIRSWISFSCCMTVAIYHRMSILLLSLARDSATKRCLIVKCLFVTSWRRNVSSNSVPCTDAYVLANDRRSSDATCP